MARREKVRLEKTIRPYVHLYRSAEYHVALAQAIRGGNFWTCLAANVLVSFTFEAYLNHIGQFKMGKQWDEVERRRWDEKLELVLDAIPAAKAPMAPGKRPRQTIKMAFAFRNSVAHGRTTTESEEYVDDGADPAIHKVSWEKECNPSTSKRYLQDVKRAIELLHASAGTDQPAFPPKSEAKWSFTPI